jgi:hypothetical protein
MARLKKAPKAQVHPSTDLPPAANLTPVGAVARQANLERGCDERNQTGLRVPVDRDHRFPVIMITPRKNGVLTLPFAGLARRSF